MNNNVVFSEVVRKFEEKEHLRIVAFGASNTERHLPSVHWTDVLELGLRSRFGRKFQMINAGVSGNNTRQAVARLERDVLFYQPDIVIITFAGNDCNIEPGKFVPEDEFTGNLKLIAERIKAQGATVIFQTYYKAINEFIVPQRAAFFDRYMKAVREVAKNGGYLLVDQYALFDKINRNYRVFNLMRDPLHTNENGNMLMGLNLTRYFDVDFNKISWRDRLLAMHKLLEDTINQM